MKQCYARICPRARGRPAYAAMIQYDQGSWAIGYAFSRKGSCLPRAAAVSAPCSLFTIALNIVYNYNPEVFGDTSGALSSGSSGILRGFTFILGFLIVFRSQKAYARWWEGGTLLQQLRGEWFNAFSSLLAFCNASEEKKVDVEVFQHQLVRMMSMLYGNALKQVSAMKDNSFEFIDLDGFDPHALAYMQESHDACEVTLQWIQRLIVEANGKDIIKIAPPILSRVYNQLGNGIVKLNNARKIHDFPIPFPLAQVITIMLLVHWFVTAMVVAIEVKNPITAGIFSFVVIMSYWSINYIAVELEMPFGDDPNDLPLHEMQIDLNSSLCALINPKASHPPSFDFNKPVHIQLKRQKVLLDQAIHELHSRRPDLDLRKHRKTITVTHAQGIHRGSARGPLHVEGAEGKESLFRGNTLPSLGAAGAHYEPGADVGTRQKLPEVHSHEVQVEKKVDNCFEGSCEEGSATEGSCTDTEYRDSQGQSHERAARKSQANFHNLPAIILEEVTLEDGQAVANLSRGEFFSASLCDYGTILFERDEVDSPDRPAANC